jgi:magnesium transporter
MSKLYKRSSKKAGASPGTLVYVGEKKAEKVKISIINYEAGLFEEKEAKSIEETLVGRDKPAVSWINIDGLHQIDILEKIGAHFNIHPLVLEDILNTRQRPKMEAYDDYIFVVLKMLQLGNNGAVVEAEQVSLILGPYFVISFQEKAGDVFNPIRERIKNKESRLRKNGPDYLVYRLLDTIVDHYFVILERLGERIEDLEEELLEKPEREALGKIQGLKRELIFLRKSVWPLREIISGLGREETALIKEPTEIFLRDVYDHTIQVIDTVENFRDMVAGMLDIYLSSLSNKMNEVMKVLTIIATIFIPLTFIAGIYGMNFDSQASPWNMPELHWYFGYPTAVLLMVIVGVVMIIYFKRKKWF